ATRPVDTVRRGAVSRIGTALAEFARRAGPATVDVGLARTEHSVRAAVRHPIAGVPDARGAIERQIVEAHHEAASRGDGPATEGHPRSLEAQQGAQGNPTSRTR